MKSYEVHLIETESDIELADLAGLTDGIDTYECANCWEAIGALEDGTFEPYVITLTYKDDGYSVCIECSAPVIEPEVDEL
jgi:DNA-directed RNA polymerase subunit RPC12/RpoP